VIYSQLDRERGHDGHLGRLPTPTFTLHGVEVKSCGGCGTLKPLAAFAADRHQPSGRDCYCRPCRQEVNRRSYRRTHG